MTSSLKSKYKIFQVQNGNKHSDGQQGLKSMIMGLSYQG